MSGSMKAEESVSVLPNIEILVEEGNEVKAGTQLTAASVDPKKLADQAGLSVAQK